ncbi:UNVERIFIED_CONTAM: hypothetical protein GTU68_067445 [Idotea baltica]|nr:hypothetical protein [Idotea baltica]
MASVDDYRFHKYENLPLNDQNFVNKTLEKCKTLYVNETVGNEGNESTILYLSDVLLYSCDLCFIEETFELWGTGVCDVPNKVAFHICVYILYTLILIMAVIGNILVVYVILSSIKMKTVTNYFIANLAVGDLCMAIFCVPFSFLSTLILQYWPFGFHLCVTVNYLQAVSVFVSAYTLVAISIDRYLAIIYPLRPRMTRFQAKVIITVVWFLSLATTVPIAVFSDIMQPQVNFYRLQDLKVCQENWGKYRKDAGAAYSATLMLLQYFLPIMVLIFTYTRIAIAIWGKKHLGEHPIKLDRLARSKRKVITKTVIY